MPDEQGMISCSHCQGTGKVKCDCPGAWLQPVEGHPLNVTDYRGQCGSQGYMVSQCFRCKRVWAIRWQFHPGTGSDSHFKDCGFVDPFSITKRHY